jgi:hypothetical protein
MSTYLPDGAVNATTEESSEGESLPNEIPRLTSMSGRFVSVLAHGGRVWESRHVSASVEIIALDLYARKPDLFANRHGTTWLLHRQFIWFILPCIADVLQSRTSLSPQTEPADPDAILSCPTSQYRSWQIR